MKRSTKFRNQRDTHAIFELSLSKTSVGLKRGKGLDVDRNDAERIDRLLAPLAMQVLECPGTVGGYVQPLVFCGATFLVNMRDIEPRKEDDGFDGAFLSP